MPFEFLILKDTVRRDPDLFPKAIPSRRSTNPWQHGRTQDTTLPARPGVLHERQQCWSSNLPSVLNSRLARHVPTFSPPTKAAV